MIKKLPYLLIAATLTVFSVFLVSRNRDLTYSEPVNYQKTEVSTPPTEVSTSLPAPEIVERPSRKVLSGINQSYQTFNNCGPAALSMALSYFDINVSQKQLGDDLRPYQNPSGDNDDKSVTLEELAEKSKEYGFVPYHRPAGDFDIIEKFIQIDIPVITRTWLTVDESIGHFRVVKGYDKEKQLIIQDDSYQGPNKEYSYADFNEMWKKFNYEYLVLVPKDKQADAEAILANYLDEEYAWEKSVKISTEQLEQNQSDIFARLNLSVAYYHLGDYQKAISEYEKVENDLPFRTLWYQLEPILSYYEVGDYNRVFEISDNIIENGNRAFSELYNLRGTIYRIQGKEDLAEQEFTLAEKYKNPR